MLKLNKNSSLLNSTFMPFFLFWSLDRSSLWKLMRQCICGSCRPLISQKLDPCTLTLFYNAVKKDLLYFLILGFAINKKQYSISYQFIQETCLGHHAKDKKKI